MNINYIKMDKLTPEEKKEIGVFVSYSHSDSHLKNEIIDFFLPDMNVLSDDELNPEDENFHDHILEMLYKSTCVVVTGKITPWVSYEIGCARAMNKPIYSYKTEESKLLLDVIHFDDVKELKRKCMKNKLFQDLFENPTNDLKIEDFNQNVLQNVDYVSLKITIPGIEDIANKNSYKFSYLIPQFGRDLTIPEEKKKNKCISNNKALEIENTCSITNALCPSLVRHNPTGLMDLVLLNKVYDAYKIDGNQVNFLIPVHKKYGVTFKLFIDIFDFTMHDRIVTALKNTFDPSVLGESTSGAQDRIYILLEQNKLAKLFKTREQEGFENNYICPGVFE